MKKLFLLLAAAAVSFAANAAYTLNNPIGEDGRYIVKYDCEKGQFAAANDFEYSQTIVLAIDITGTWLADWVKDTPTAEGASRGIAINFWGNNFGTNGDVRRLKQINGNIWGMTVNLKQIAVADGDHPHPEFADTIGDVAYMGAQFFGFEYTPDNPGAGWWMWADQPIDSYQADGSDCFFATLPYSGNNIDEELFNDDYSNGDIYGFGITGYAAPCLDEATLVENVATEAHTRKVIENGNLYMIKNGVRYNVLGAIVK